MNLHLQNLHDLHPSSWDEQFVVCQNRSRIVVSYLCVSVAFAYQIGSVPMIKQLVAAIMATGQICCSKNPTSRILLANNPIHFFSKSGYFHVISGIHLAMWKINPVEMFC